MTPDHQAVVDRIMVLAYDYRLGKLDGHPYGGPSYNALRTAIEELAQQAAEAQALVKVQREVLDRSWHAVKDANMHPGRTGELLHEAIARMGAALASQPLVPAGWKIVPVEPTEEMVAAWPSYRYGAGHEAAIYRAMLAASPAVQEAPAAEHAADGWEAPDFRKAWQGGLTNEELEQWWRLKLPHVEATNRDICVFALGVEVGAGMGEAPKPSTVLSDLREGSLPEGRACEAPSGEAVEPGGEATRPEASAEQAAQQADARDAALTDERILELAHDAGIRFANDEPTGQDEDLVIAVWRAAMAASKKEG
jgi:hypothetical protein